MASAKHWLYVTHRWFGIVLCLFMALWFFSGVVMMYVGYPKLTPAERLARMPELTLADCCIPPAAALGDAGTPREVRLATVQGRPAYLVIDARGRHRAVDARTGAPLGASGEAEALAAARQYEPDARATWLGTIDEDAWTHSRALDAHRPLHRVRLEDDASTLLYVSSATGEVVRDATGVERAWNWVGAWLHWLYMFRGNVFDPWWSDIVVWLSTAGTLLAITGTIVGILRWRFRGRYRSGGKSPYRESFMRWHHWTGLAFALVTFTWILSGLLSMGAPWKPFEQSGPRPDQRAFAGGALDPAAFARTPQSVVGALGGELRVRELRWIRFDGAAWFLATDGAGRTRLVPAADGPPIARHDAPVLLAAAAKLMPHARIVEHTWLESYDTWYYARAPHTMLGHVDRPLPMLRVKFDDPAGTWVHVDPYSGTVHGSLDSTRRVKRWLFAFLHSFDWLPLLERRPLWDVLLVVLSLGGFAVCVTGVVIGWRRLRPKRRTAAVSRGGTRVPAAAEG